MKTDNKTNDYKNSSRKFGTEMLTRNIQRQSFTFSEQAAGGGRFRERLTAVNGLEYIQCPNGWDLSDLYFFSKKGCRSLSFMAERVICCVAVPVHMKKNKNTKMTTFVNHNQKVHQMFKLYYAEVYCRSTREWDRIDTDEISLD